MSALLQSTAEPDATALVARTILVTDDSAASREILCRLLERAGMIVTLANDGLEALRCVQARARGFDVVLMDMVMENMDGAEALRRIRLLPGGRDCALVAMSTNVDVTWCGLGELPGVAPLFLKKPFRSAQLIGIVLRALGIDGPNDGEVQGAAIVTSADDVAEAIERCGGDVGMLRRLLQTLAVQGPQSLHAARAAMEAGLVGDVSRRLDELRGEMLSLGLSVPVNAVSKLESHLHAAQAPDRAHVLRQLTGIETCLREGIATMLALPARVALSAALPPAPALGVSLGEELLKRGLLAAAQLESALQLQKKSRKRLGVILVESGAISEEAIASVLASQARVPFIDLRRFELDVEMVRSLGETDTRRFRALVLERRDAGFLVGVVDPFDLRALDQLAAVLKAPIDIAVITLQQFLATADRIHRKTELISEFAREVERDLDVVDLYGIGDARSAEDAPVVRLLQTLFEDAAQVRASDIHIEPEEQHLVVRFRIDGVLHLQARADTKIAAPLMVRIKLMANLDIGEKRLPQDGRITVKTDQHRIDVRLSTIPTQFGESAVMRLLIQSDNVLRLEQSGMAPAVLTVFRKLIHAPHGMVLVTGPTGSGKTTTLYGALQELNQPGVKILTCEDPVEYRVPGLNQVQVNERIDLGFARVLRSFLRQDPDVILVGEIRDRETAEIAARAAMTGHLVLSTLHTNDSVSTPGRLLDLGLPPYMVASTLLTVVAQRLVRKICPYCQVEHQCTPGEREWLEHHLGTALPEVSIRRGTGCERCNGIGFSGRRAIYEMLAITPALAGPINRGEMTEFAVAARTAIGHRTIEREAVNLVLQGVTAVSEAMRVVSSAEI